MKRKILILIISAGLLLPACNPLSKLGERAVKQNRVNVEYLGKQLNRYLDKDTAADKDVVKDKKLAIESAISLAKKLETQVKEKKK